MIRTLASLLGATIAAATLACGGTPAPAEDPGGEGTVTIADKTFKINKLMLSYDPGEDGFYRIEGDDAARPHEDCLPGLASGLALYGDLPEGVTTLADFNGRELPFEFSGDGDDRNLCFVGSNGLLGVERGTVRFTAIDDKKVSFTFSGSFVVYDGEGGRSPSEVSASGSGVAHLETP
jgi:hypothetical protein